MPADDPPPNIILIITDDQGYGDLGCYGAERIDTPCIDELAAGGARLTDFYAGEPVCGPSRAGLLTGRYPIRIEEAFEHDDYHTIPAEHERLVPELLSDAGYTTKAIGKWHLAGSGTEAIATANDGTGFDRFSIRHPELMPTERGFDSYFGIPYSNDMTPSVLLDDRKPIEGPVQQSTLTTRYTDQAIQFVAQQADEPFFLYLAYNMPHTPLHPAEEFHGESPYGLFADAVEEIDYHVGRLLDTLAFRGIAEETLVIYTTDHGPWIEPERTAERTTDAVGSRLQAGSSGPLRGRKMTTWEGGVRVPCLLSWPGAIPAEQTIDAITMNMDLMPTLVDLAGEELPAERPIDGESLLPLVTDPTAAPPHDTFYYYKDTHLNAVRSGQWKLVRPRARGPDSLGWYGRLQESIDEPQLYDLRADPGETHDIAEDHPEIVTALEELAQAAAAELGDENQYGADPE